MIRTTSKNVFIWKIVRFGFYEGTVTLGGGISLKGLLDCLGGFDAQKSRTKGEVGDTNPNSLGDNANPNSCEGGDPNCGDHALDWAVWRGVYQGGPLEAMLTAVFGEEDDAMVLKFLTEFFAKWKDREQCRCCATSDLGTAFRDCRHFVNPVSNWKLSLQERCALAHLRSASHDVRRQGLRVLLDLLFDRRRELPSSNALQRHAQSAAQRGPSHSTPASSRLAAANPTAPHSSGSNPSPHLGNRENLNLLSGLMAVMDRPLTSHPLGKPKHYIGDQTQRALQAAQMKWSEFEDMKSDRSTTPAVARPSRVLQWPQVLEWVDSGFLEALLREGTQPGEETQLIPVEDIAEACVQAVHVVSGESTHRIVTRLISQLHKFVDVFGTLRIDAAHHLDPMKAPASQIATVRLRSSFATMSRFGRLLALLLSSSASIASSFAESHGLTLILELYSLLAHKLPTNVGAFDMANFDVQDEVLPGEVYEPHFHQTKTCKSHVSHHPKPNPKPQPLWVNHHENKRKSSSKATMPLTIAAHEVSVSSPILHSFFTRNLMVVEDAARTESNSESNLLQKKHDCVVAVGDNKLGSVGKRDDDIEVDYFPLLTLERVIGIIWRTKLSLLQSFISVWESQSIFMNKCKIEMKHMFSQETKSVEFLSWFLSDLMEGHLSTLGFAHVCESVTKSIFKVICLLDNDLLENDAFAWHHVQKIQCNAQYMTEGPWWSGPGPPQTQLLKTKLSDSLLMELKKKIDHIISNLMTTLSNNPLKDVQKFSTCKTFHQKNNSVHFWMLWVHLACLIMALSNYIIYWPKKKSSFKDVLEYCGENFHHVLTILSNLGPVSSWIPPQILTMQSILKILGLCIQDSTTANAKENWSPYGKILWEMMIDKWTHWNCIQSYISWLTLEACQSCLNNVFNNFQKELNESIHSYYFSLENQLNVKKYLSNDFEIFHSSKFFKKKGIVFLHLVVMLVKQKICTYNENFCKRSELQYFCDDDALWFLQEIMNPSHGLLFLAIKNKYTKECEECEIKNPNQNFSPEIIFNIKQQSLILLAQIFSLQFFALKPRALKTCDVTHANIFFTRKYLMSFLNVLYCNFENAYTKVLQQLRFNSIYSSQGSRPGENENKCSSVSNEQNSFKTNENNHEIIHYTTDQMLSLCYSYAHVLLVIAKNLNEDGRLIFKDLCIMDFLIHEISLEYEFSHVVESELFCKVGAKEKSNCINFQVTTSRKDANMTYSGLNISNPKTRPIEMDCALPSLAQEYNIGNSISMSPKLMVQKIMEKNTITMQSPILIPEECILDSKRMATICDNNTFEKKDLLKSSCNNIFGDKNLSVENSSSTNKTSRKCDYTSKIFVYSGRFFDLNEEVEQELAKEDDENHEESHSSILNMYNEYSEFEQETRFASIESNNNEDSSISSTSTIFSERVEKVIPSMTNSRPKIPKLNLTNAFDKNQSIFEEHLHAHKIGHNFLKVESEGDKWNIPSPSQISCDNERSKRPIYHNLSLHVILLELIIYLMLSPELVFIIIIFFL